MVDIAIKGLLSLAPVLVFLTGLRYLDSYKLVPIRSMLITICAGAASAWLAVIANETAMIRFDVDINLFVRYGAPVVEEICKAMWPLALIRMKRVGFMVDAGVLGFGAGAGFALVENVYYLQALESTTLFTWIIRGFGTAVMHGGTTAIFAMLTKNRMDIKNSMHPLHILPGLGVAALIHSAYNHVFLSPLANTLIVLASLPFVMLAVFQRSERATQQWLGVGFDSDADMLNMIISGNIADTPLGQYLHSLSTRFKPEVVVDLLCYLRIYLELAVQAKGILMMREAGFDVPPAPDVEGQFSELRYLEKTIGATGRLALAPFLRTSPQDLWQLHMLRSS